MPLTAPIAKQAAKRDEAKMVDAYLQTQYGLGLEEVLCDGCLIGRLDQRFGLTSRLVLREQRVEREDDGGAFGTYAGILILEGLWYRFDCRIFVDASGPCFLADLGAFEAVEWKLRVAV